MAPQQGKKKQVAVIGGGVSGLAAAWHLTQNAHAKDTYEVQLFEDEDRLGGHANTVTCDGVDLDVGFMVFNLENYPNLVAWFDALGVKYENSDMSYSVSLDEGKTVEWSSDGLNGLLAKRSQAFSPKFHAFVKDMLRFNTKCTELLSLPEGDPRRGVTMGQYLRDHNYSEAFCSYYIFPMMAAIWSSSVDEVMSFPAESLIAFFANHKLAAVTDRRQVSTIGSTLYVWTMLRETNCLLNPNPTLLCLSSYLQWMTPTGRSQSYTLKMKEILGEKAKLSTPVVSAKKQKDGKYELFTTDDKSLGSFDELVFACHAPTASKILEGAFVESDKLVDLLSKIEYADSVMYIHSDPNLMPKRRRAWTSWNSIGNSELLSVNKLRSTKKAEAMEGGDSGFGNTLDGQATDTLEGKEGRMKAVYITYWLNRLQNLETDKEFFVSLNPHEKPDPALTYKRKIVGHPQFNTETMKARKQLMEECQGKDGLWFCGAWAGYGFHEDGCSK